MQRVGFHHFSILSLSVTKVVFFQFQSIFSGLTAFLGTTPIYLIKIIFILHCTISFWVDMQQFHKIRWRTKKIVSLFLLAPSHFLADLIKFTFLILPSSVFLWLCQKTYRYFLIFTSIHLMYLMIHFLFRELKKIILSKIFFKFNNYLFSTGTETTNNVHDGIPVSP